MRFKVKRIKLKVEQFLKRAVASALIVGALPLLFCARASAQESRWLDDYKAPVGFTYGAQARVQAAYMWRGLYCGGPNIQGSANVGYGGLYFDMWWNLGVTDWKFEHFQPEVDFSLGFSRWGLNLYLLYIHNFNTGLFDFNNYPDKGNRLEIDVAYTVSSKLPLGIRWATRIAASDGYRNAQGDTVRAYSSYAEINYTQNLPYGLSLYGAFGFSPWKSIYSFFQRDFTVCNVEVRLRKDWDAGNRCGLMLQGQLCINPSELAADHRTAEWHPYLPGNQSVNANITFGVYLK